MLGKLLDWIYDRLDRSKCGVCGHSLRPGRRLNVFYYDEPSSCSCHYVCTKCPIPEEASTKRMYQLVSDGGYIPVNDVARKFERERKVREVLSIEDIKKRTEEVLDYAKEKRREYTQKKNRVMATIADELAETAKYILTGKRKPIKPISIRH